MLTQAEIRSAFTRRIDPVRTTAAYRLAVVGVAFAMVLLPLLYVALIVGSAWGCWWYATTVMPYVISNVRNGKLIVIAATPLVAAPVMIVFLLKPLVARLPKESDTLPLDRADAPLLFELVESLCDMLGSPRPRRIDIDVRVNAAASLRRGLLSIVSNDLVLTVGLPLVNGLTLRQFTGVLAHEFGHFSQGAGMRMGYVIRLMNYWFQRVVFLRDSWDEWLDNLASDHGGIMVGGARLCVGVSRWLLMRLMQAGHAISSYLQRQMEFDADQAEIRTVGSKTFIETSRQLHVLDLADQWAHSFQQDAWRKGRLGNDLPALIQANLREIPKSEIEEALVNAMNSSPGMYDSHPPTGQRIAKAEERAWDGVFTLDGNATGLFGDFAGVSRRASEHFYAQMLETPPSPDQLVSNDTVLAEGLESARYARSRRRLFQGLFDGGCWLRLPAVGEPAPDDALAGWFEQSKKEAEAALGPSEEGATAMNRLLMCHRVSALVDAGFQIDAASLGLASADPAVLAGEIRSEEANFASASARLHQACPALLRFIAGGIARLGAEVPPAWLHLLRRLGGMEPEQNRLIAQTGAIQTLLDQDPSKTQAALSQWRPRLDASLRGLVDELAPLPMPWPSEGCSSVGDFLRPAKPGEPEVRAAIVIGRIADLYTGTLGRLAEKLERFAPPAHD
ncbi:MAG: M48 family metalloprotease [Bryobacteraceae bacterium]